MVVVKGEGRFADAVRRALEYAQSRGVDLSGVEVEVVADPSIKDFGAYADHLGGLKFRIRYNPRYTNDVVLASHEAGHVAHWAWAVKTGMTHFFGKPDVIEPLAEAFGAVVARQLFGVPVTFKEAPHNLTKILPERTTHVTVTVEGKPMPVKVPEWSDYRSRYRAGVFVAPYFYNMTNWAHVFGNFTAAPADVIETVHKAWQSGAVEVVPGWGPVWRKEPTWKWPSTNRTSDGAGASTHGASTRQTTSDGVKSEANTVVMNNTQRTNDSTVGTNVPQVVNTVKQDDADRQKTPAVVTIQPTGDVPPLSPSTVQRPKYFSEDIVPKYRSLSPEWDEYTHGRRVLLVFRNWEHLSGGRRDSVVSGGTLLIDKNDPERDSRIVWDRRVPAPAFYDPDAWIEIVDEKTGKVLARLRSNELYKVATGDKRFINLFWAHVAAEEKWPGWERFIDRAKELEEKLGAWRRTSGIVAVNPDGTASAVRVTNAPTEYVPPEVPDDVRKQFGSLLSDLKKLGEKVNLRNVGEVHDRFIQLRDEALGIARAYPQLIDKANEAVGRVGSAIRAASSKLYDALAKAAGRDSFWRGEGDVKTPIGAYRYDPATGAFLLTLYDNRPVAENIVGYIKDDGTPVVLKKTRNMSEALEEYDKLLKSPTSGQDSSKQTSAQTTAQQSSGNRQAELPFPLDALTKTPVFGPVLQATKLSLQAPPSGGSKAGSGSHSEPMPVVQTQTSTQSMTQPSRQRDFLWPVYRAVDFLADALKAGAGIKLAAFGVTALGGAKSFTGSGSGEQQFVATAPKPALESRVVYNRRRGMPILGGTSQPDRSDYLVDSGFAQPPSGRQQKTGEPVSIRHVRPLDYVLAEQESRRSGAAQVSSDHRPADYAVRQQSGGSERPAQPPPSTQLTEVSQPQSGSKEKRYRGRPVAVPI